jgi:hypothetical protein
MGVGGMPIPLTAIFLMGFITDAHDHMKKEWHREAELQVALFVDLGSNEDESEPATRVASASMGSDEVSRTHILVELGMRLVDC